jgi:hypothetical protein
MPYPRLPAGEATRRIEAIEQALREGCSPPGQPGKFGQRNAVAMGLQRCGVKANTSADVLARLEEAAGRKINWALYPGPRVALDAPAPRFVAPEIPPSDVPVDELIERLAANYERRANSHAAKQWARFTLHDKGPYVLAVVGDPHLDDPGTDWTLLRQHHELLRLPHVHGICLGDVTNNWAGKLQRLYAEQDVTRTQAWKLASWFFQSVPWLIIIKGNHDLWSSSYGQGDPLDWMSRGAALLEDWQAKFEVATPDGHVTRIWAAHDFKGTSIYNPIHGPMRAQKFSAGEADVYCAGHQHHWELFCGEDALKSSRPYWIARARGYKSLDEHADRHQFGTQRHGSTIGIVVDPSRDGPAALHCYADLAEAVEVMQWRRSKCQGDAADTTTPTGQKRRRTRAR